jgi:hypothetical protein
VAKDHGAALTKKTRPSKPDVLFHRYRVEDLHGVVWLEDVADELAEVAAMALTPAVAHHITWAVPNEPVDWLGRICSGGAELFSDGDEILHARS